MLQRQAHRVHWLPSLHLPTSSSAHRFLCCFLNSLPLDSALRVWDLLFFEGSAVVLFRVALALIEIYDQVGRGVFRTRACGTACSCSQAMQCAASPSFLTSCTTAAGPHVLPRVL